MSDRAGRDVISPFQARQTDRQTDRQTGRQSDRQARQAGRETDRHNVNCHVQSYCSRDGKARCDQSFKLMNRQIDRQSDKRAGRLIDA